MDTQAHWSALDNLLMETRALWQGLPFDVSVRRRWQAKFPSLWRWLSTLTPESLQELSQDASIVCEKLSAFIPQAIALKQFSQVPVLPSQSLQALPIGFDAGIPGRKWRQIGDFFAALPSPNREKQYVEWCAGKGFLGRFLAQQTGLPLVSLEWQGDLCAVAESAARQWRLPIVVKEGDAFTLEAQSLITEESHAVALHACGDLHGELLKAVVRQGAACVSVSPCCYHLIKGTQYTPFSAMAKQSALQLSRHDLRMCLQESVTAGKRVRDLRFVEVSFRLGLDHLQRQWRGIDEYHSVPNVQKSVLTQGFEAFCRWAAKEKGWSVPENVDFSQALVVGEQAYWDVQRMELVRQLFRRPLEIWLLLDRVMFLQESGYEVRYGTFCEKAMTPRNLLLTAQKKPS